mgnify:CR=1 FL=1
MNMEQILNLRQMRQTHAETVSHYDDPWTWLTRATVLRKTWNDTEPVDRLISTMKHLGYKLKKGYLHNYEFFNASAPKYKTILFSKALIGA